MSLQKILTRKKVSKYRFAKMLDMNSSNVFRYFREGFDPKLSTIIRFAKVLDMKPSKLVKEMLGE